MNIKDCLFALSEADGAGCLTAASDLALAKLREFVPAERGQGLTVIARLPGFEGALPINSVTALIGAPVALWVILGRK